MPSRGIARKAAVISVIAVVLVAAAGYSLFAYEHSYPPFCSGYPPGGNCAGNYSYTFTISVNYTGPWRLTYQDTRAWVNPAPRA